MKCLFSFEDVTSRAKEAFKIKDDKQLAEMIGMSSGSFHNRKKARSLPYKELLELTVKQKIDFDWLLTGEGKMYKKGAGEAQVDSTQKILDNLSSMTEAQKDMLSGFIENQKRLNELEKIVLEIQRQVSK